MKFRLGVYLFLLAGIVAQMAACGGGGGGGPAVTPISVTAAKNPVLVNRSTTIIANFAPYTSANMVSFGSTVNFAVSSPGAVSSLTARTKAGGIATVSVKSLQNATVTVAASSGNFAGSTTVSFIPMPASARVVITPRSAISNLGGLQFDVTNDVPITFSSYSTLKSSTTLSVTNPVAGANNLSQLTAALISTAGMNVTSTSTLFLLSYTIPTTALDVPVFKVNQSSVVAAFTNNSTVRPAPVLKLSPTYYDSTGKVLFP